MVGLLGGFLSALGNAGAGAAKAVRENAEENMKRTLEMEKEAMLQKRRLNEMRLEQEFQKGRDKSAQDFQITRDEASRTEARAMEDIRFGNQKKAAQFNYDLGADERARTAAHQEKMAAMTAERWGIEKEGLLASKAKMKEEQAIEDAYIRYVSGDMSQKELENQPARIQVGVESKIQERRAKGMKADLENRKTAAEITKILSEASGDKTLSKITQDAAKQAEDSLKEWRKDNPRATPDQVDAFYNQAYSRFIRYASGGKIGAGTANSGTDGNNGGGTRTLDELKAKVAQKNSNKDTVTNNTATEQPKEPVNEFAGIEQMNPSDIKDSYKSGLLSIAEPGTTPASIVRNVSNAVGAGNFNKRDPLTTDFRSGEDDIIRALRLAGVESNYEKATLIRESLKRKYPDATDEKIAEMIFRAGKRRTGR